MSIEKIILIIVLVILVISFITLIVVIQRRKMRRGSDSDDVSWIDLLNKELAKKDVEKRLNNQKRNGEE